MTPDDIRNRFIGILNSTGGESAMGDVRCQVMIEIAAQLAELNQTLNRSRHDVSHFIFEHIGFPIHCVDKHCSYANQPDHWKVRK